MQVFASPPLTQLSASSLSIFGNFFNWILLARASLVFCGSYLSHMLHKHMDYCAFHESYNRVISMKTPCI